MADDDLAAKRRQEWIGALLEERRGYEVAGRADRVAEVDAALVAAGYKAPAGRRAKPSETTKG